MTLSSLKLSSSFNTFSKEIVCASILKHKEKGVRAWACLCVSEILRIYVPTPPYTESQLKVLSFPNILGCILGFFKPTIFNYG